MQAIGEGGYAVAYKAKHGRFGTVVYKELNAQVLNDRYALSKHDHLIDFLNSGCLCGTKAHAPLMSPLFSVLEIFLLTLLNHNHNHKIGV